MNRRIAAILALSCLVGAISHGAQSTGSGQDEPTAWGSVVYLKAKDPVLPIQLQLRELWQYDTIAWKWVLMDDAPQKWAGAGRLVAAQAPGATEVQFDLSKVIGSPVIGLYCAKWRVAGVDRANLIYVGELPEDFEIGDAPPGMITTGVPTKNGTIATHVPDPAIYCRVIPTSATTKPTTKPSIQLGN